MTQMHYRARAEELPGTDDANNRIPQSQWDFSGGKTEEPNTSPSSTVHQFKYSLLSLNMILDNLSSYVNTSP